MEKWDVLEQELRGACSALELRRNEPMSRHTSFRVGGPAALMALPQGRGEAKTILRVAAEVGVKPFFLGNGSNLLVADEGYPGFVVKLSGVVLGRRGFNRCREVNRCLRVEAGIPLAKLAMAALSRGLTGLEFAAGIPGTLGGAVLMNAGAYGGEMSQVVTAVTYLDEKGKETTLSREECKFSYRNSIFSAHPEWLIVEAEFKLQQDDPAEIGKRMDDLSAQRKAKQPLEYPSAGSTFKRPPPLADGTPVYAAALIDQCGLKGLTVGGAQVSEKHAGFIINKGGATCADILALVEQVKARVLDRTGVKLELEIKLLGV